MEIALFLVWNPNDEECYYNDPREDLINQLNIRCVGTLEQVIEEAEEYYHEHFECEEDYDENFEINSAEELDEFWDANGYAMTSFIVGLEGLLNPNRELKHLLEDLKVEIDYWTDEMRSMGSHKSVEYYKNLNRRIDEELKKCS